MGFISTATTATIKGKLTPIGRQLLVTNTNALISNFALGDSDADYTVYSGLTLGQVPDFSGDNGSTNNGGANYKLKSQLRYNTNTLIKPVETSSLSINTTFSYLGINSVHYSAGTISQYVINRLNGATDVLTNLFYSFNLPKTNDEQFKFTGTTFNTGGYSDTELSGMSQDKVLVISLDSSEYGEIIDGKTIKLDISTTASTYTLYGTFQNTNATDTTYDNNVTDSSNSLTSFGMNVCLLFSDAIQKPNADSTKSWSTGYATNKPFSTLPKKETWNIINNSNLSLVADKPVGIAYLDKGFIVITEPTIVDNFDVNDSSATGTTIEFNSVVSSVNQQITCVADRNSFGTSTNPTYTTGDTPRITEIALLDASGNVIAMAKTNKTFYKPLDDIMVFNVIIDY